MPRENNGLQEYSQTVSPSQTVSFLPRYIAVLTTSRVPMLKRNQRTTRVFSNRLTVSNCLVPAPVHSCTDIIPGTDAKRNQRTTRVFSNRLTVSNCLVRDPAHSCFDIIPGTDANRNQRTTRVFSNRPTVSNCLVRDPAHSCSATIPGTDAKRKQWTIRSILKPSHRLKLSRACPVFPHGIGIHHAPSAQVPCVCRT